LLAELDSLRRETRSNYPDPAPSVSFAPTLDGMEPDASQGVADVAHPGPEEEVQRGDETIPLGPDLSYEIAEYSGVPTTTTNNNHNNNNGASLPRTVQNLTVAGEDIDACFQM
jgi:hypothetical protein